MIPGWNEAMVLDAIAYGLYACNELSDNQSISLQVFG